MSLSNIRIGGRLYGGFAALIFFAVALAGIGVLLLNHDHLSFMESAMSRLAAAA